MKSFWNYSKIYPVSAIYTKFSGHKRFRKKKFKRKLEKLEKILQKKDLTPYVVNPKHDLGEEYRNLIKNI